jgi:hypothetical protein
VQDFENLANIDKYISVRYAAINALKMECQVTAVQLLSNSQYGKKLQLTFSTGLLVGLEGKRQKLLTGTGQP